MSGSYIAHDTPPYFLIYTIWDHDTNWFKGKLSRICTMSRMILPFVWYLHNFLTNFTNEMHRNINYTLQRNIHQMEPFTFVFGEWHLNIIQINRIGRREGKNVSMICHCIKCPLKITATYDWFSKEKYC